MGAGVQANSRVMSNDINFETHVAHAGTQKFALVVEAPSGCRNQSELLYMDGNARRNVKTFSPFSSCLSLRECMSFTDSLGPCSNDGQERAVLRPAALGKLPRCPA